MPQTDVNTDLIFPQRFLRRPDRNAMGDYLFHSLRYNEHGGVDPAFILNQEPYDDATILIAGRNFGSGSSREHAPWALRGHGFRVLISSMFADIFRTNCVNNGIIPATVDEAVLQVCLSAAANPQNARFAVDLEARTVSHSTLGAMPFGITDGERDQLLSGHDFIDVTLADLPAIEAYERRAARQSWHEIQTSSG